MLKKISCLFVAGLIVFLSGCQQKAEPKNQVRVGTIAGPETALMEVAGRYAKRCYGLTVKIITFTDYSLPNTALNDGSIDANMFQHRPFLTKQVQARGYKIKAVANTFIYPMGVYSKKITNLAELKSGDKVAIPNDPSNEARALLLLQKAGVIKLTPNVSVTSTVHDIVSNPKHLTFIALDAAQLPRSLRDVAVAVINTNYAVPAGLRPSNAIFKERNDSLYANVVAVRADDTQLQKVKELVASLHSKAVLAAAKRIFGDSAIPAWNLAEKQLPCTAAQ